MFGSRLAVRNAIAIVCLSSLVLFSAARWGATPALAAGTISGTVFQDYNGNGERDQTSTMENEGSGTIGVAVDRGLAGVTVTAFNSAGVALKSTLTEPDGSYELQVDGAGPYRVEFSGLLTGFEPGPVGSNNGSTVRFVPDGDSSEVDLGIHLPGEYCQNNPDLLTSCFRGVPQPGFDPPAPETQYTVVSFPYSAGSETGTDKTIPEFRVPATHELQVFEPVTGSVWGLEHSRSRNLIYAAAFFKRHVPLGPGENEVRDPAPSTTSDDPAAIYLLDRTSSDLLGVFSVPGATTNSHDSSNYLTDNGNTGWDAVGKTALGGIALSDDETTLYVMNLQNRTLYALDATGGAPIRWQTVPGVTAIDGSPAAGVAPPLSAPSALSACNELDIRPFAVQFNRGELYVGITCTAESTGNRNDLFAYVYRVNPDTLVFDAAPAFSFPLSYPRGLANQAGAPSAQWLPWEPTFSDLGAVSGYVFYPQPWLTDLTFEGDNLLLAFRDRLADQVGFDSPSNPAVPDTVLYRGVGVGDYLRACADGDEWVLESNSRCGGAGSGPQNNGTGPGQGEFYFDDGYGISGQGFNHDETGLGGSTFVPGFPDVVVTNFDAFPYNPPFEVNNAGMRWFSNTTGAYKKAYVLYDTDIDISPLTFGKANGLGDLIVLCDEAPIEIGNRVWRDDNLNGIQDPGEPALPRVKLELYEGDNTTPIAEATTDDEGNYIFSAYRDLIDSTEALRYGLDLKPGTEYTVRIPAVTGVNQQSALNGLLPTLPLTGGEVRDSNGVQQGTVVVATLTTGSVGANNHTYDFGFVAAPTAITLDSFSAKQAGAGVVVSWSTSMERDTWSFVLYRSTTGRLADAVPVTDPPLLAKGKGGGGASYTFIDESATEGPYTYWLEEHTTSGARGVYGPTSTGQISSGGPNSVWLPMVVR